ncbi:hypothetical protein OE88DRAFT_1739379 [Heliocybe sulcata]|uniref:Peptidase C14 caspase domain-containing protein n=1 Tax=Heliocybe sulcata TaxID=5364 RepID=A0A5C3MNL7_9AGAM|nr:hypothetical protein OE88DRAFT_1739379 [Heliocybe sulcata]
MPGLVQASHSGSPGPSKGRKRALLIGINYTRAQDSGNILEGPCKDARTFKQLLTERYGYYEEEITLMTDDDGTPKHLRPTRRNIREEAAKLVSGAQSGDRFVFYYAGHADQEEALNDPDEDDQLDEEIIAEDDLSDVQSPTSVQSPTGPQQRIRDNDLRRIMIDPLPAGSSLIVSPPGRSLVLLLTSEPLGHLEHYHCNSPWNPSWKTSPIAPYDLAAHRYRSVRHLPTPPHSRRPSDEGPGPDKPWTSTAAVFPVSAAEPSRPRRMTWASLTNQDEQPDCPIAEVMCTGECAQSEDEVPQVISVAACLDSQFAWEGPDGGSITQVLVKFLRQNPDCTLYDVVLELSRKLQHAGFLVEQQRTSSPDDFKDIPQPAYQLPQIGSRSALDLHSPFTL